MKYKSFYPSLSILGLMLAVNIAQAQVYDYTTPYATPYVTPAPASQPSGQSSPLYPTPSTYQSPSATPENAAEMNSPAIPDTGAGSSLATNILLIVAAFLAVSGLVSQSKQEG